MTGISPRFALRYSTDGLHNSNERLERLRNKLNHSIIDEITIEERMILRINLNSIDVHSRFLDEAMDDLDEETRTKKPFWKKFLN